MSSRVVVTDVEFKAGLAAMRSLRAAGHRVVAVAGSQRALGHWSRSADERIVVPSPGEDEDGFVAGVAGALAQEHGTILLPGNDASLEVLSRRRAELPPDAVHGFPSPDIVAGCLTKDVVATHATAAGLSVPRGIRCDSIAEVAAAVAELGGDVAVKPTTSEGSGRHRATATVVHGPEEAVRASAQILPVLVEEAILHAELGAVQGVIADGRLLAVGVQRTMLRYPRPNGGVAVRAEIVPPPAGVVERVEKLLASLGWQGMFELEFLESERGRFFIDLNPRPWGALALAVAAGVDAPAIWCAWLLGERPAPVAARVGQRYRSEDAALLHARDCLRTRRLSGLRELVPLPGTTHAYSRLLDPLPLAAHLLRPRHTAVSPRRMPKSAAPA